MDNKKHRKHKPETIELMRERRRARTVQPRSGTSKKASNLYQQLKLDYAKNPEALKWIEENKHVLSNSAQETREDLGILCDYHEQYSGIYEVKVGDVLFGDKVDSELETSNDPYDLIGDDDD